MEITNLMGLKLEYWRLLSVIGGSSAVLLYIYRIACLVDLMKSESVKLDGNNRLIYSGLIVFLPLGLGAWLYDHVVNNKVLPLIFIVPFLIACSTFIYALVHAFPNATKFNFDYLGW